MSAWDLTPTLAARVATWRRALAGNQHLSPRFRDRHAIVLAHVDAEATSLTRQQAACVAARHPRLAARLLLRLPENLATPLGPPNGAANLAPRLEGDPAIRAEIRRLGTDYPGLDAFLRAQPDLEQTSVPLHRSRQARLVSRHGAEGTLVALKWPAGSVPTRMRVQQEVAALAEYANHLADGDGDSAPAIRVHEERVLVWQQAGEDPWVLASNLGMTLEDALRHGGLATAQRARAVSALRWLRLAMLRRGVVWQGFAPRNMFLHDHDDVLWLIDFEEVTYAAHEPVKAAEQLAWHRIFFADCLTATETAAVFGVDDDSAPRPLDSAPLAADPFERALLGAGTVTWGQRRTLLARSRALEGQHQRPDARRDRGVLYGHELGHFWGDFLAPADEARIFRVLADLDDRSALTACLEVFEAGMEADICRMLRDTAAGRPDGRSPRTLALVDALENAGPAAVAAARAAVPGWYEMLRVDPMRQVDTLLLDLGTAPAGTEHEQLATYLVGAAASRRQHTGSLASTVEAGLAFMHGDDRDGQFLQYAEPGQLQRLVARPVPVDGLDFDEVLADVTRTITAYSVSQAHPGYLAFPDSGNAVAALAGSILAPLLNQNLIAVDRSAPAATFVEIQVVEWLRELVGYHALPLPALRGVRDVAGLWTTGGHLSNHVAMLVALGRAFPEARKHGLRALPTRPVVVLAGPIAHYSHSDAAFHLGLGWDGVVPVAARPGFTTDPDAVEAVLADPPVGTTPFMVVGVAGNCRTTGLDDLRALADACRRHGTWLHVDACHGGSLIFNDRLRRRHLAGIELADSVALDPHKGLFTPYPSSYVVFRDRGVLTQFSRHQQTVMADGCWDLGLITPFLGSRGFESLATWMLLQHLGTRRLGGLVESRQALVRYLDRRLAGVSRLV